MVQNLPANARDIRDRGSILGSGRSPGGVRSKPTPVFLPGESHGQGSLAGYSPWGRKKVDPTEAKWHVHILAFVEHILIIQKRAVKVFPGGLVVRIPGSHFRRCGCQVQSLIQELRSSYKLCRAVNPLSP